MMSHKSPVGCTPAGSQTFDAILKWCKKEKFKFPKCEIAVLPDTGRAIVASGDIREGELVIEVPDDTVLMAENCSIAPLLAGDLPSMCLALLCITLCYIMKRIA